jgi:hypothetical protein
MKSLLPRIFVAIVILALLAWIGFLLFFGIIPPIPVEYSAINWNGIIPGVSTSKDVKGILGSPDNVENRENLVIYKYPALDGWKYVEVWLESEKQDGELLVLGIDREMRQSLSDLSVKPIRLIEIIHQYGRPEKVTWADGCRSRALIWGKKGLIVNADANTLLKSWDEFTVDRILITIPMNTRRLIFYPWPWRSGIGIMNFNNCTEPTFSPSDNLPEDPYDWEHMPTSIKP